MKGKQDASYGPCCQGSPQAVGGEQQGSGSSFLLSREFHVVRDPSGSLIAFNHLELRVITICVHSAFEPFLSVLRVFSVEFEEEMADLSGFFWIFFSGVVRDTIWLEGTRKRSTGRC